MMGTVPLRRLGFVGMATARTVFGVHIIAFISGLIGGLRWSGS
jgi:hypothetical protein